MYFFFIGKPNIISIWAENRAGLVNKITSGGVIFDTTPPGPGVVECPRYVGVCLLSVYMIIIVCILDCLHKVSDHKSFSKFVIRKGMNILFISSNDDVYLQFTFHSI